MNNPTRDHILSTAFKLFFRKGFKEVTMSELMKSTGLSKGAFYHHFTSKEQLYNEAMGKYLITYFDEIKHDYLPELSLRENLKRIIEAFSKLADDFKHAIDNDDSGLGVYLLYIQTTIANPEFKRKLSAYHSKFFKLLESWFRNAQANNEIKPELDPILLARHISALMEGLYVLDSFGLYSQSLAENFNAIIDQFFKQIETDT